MQFFLSYSYLKWVKIGEIVFFQQTHHEFCAISILKGIEEFEHSIGKAKLILQVSKFTVSGKSMLRYQSW